MRNFNLGSLANWKQVGIGEVLDFTVPGTGHRTVSFDIVASGNIACNAVAGDDYWLVAAGDGYMTTKFSVDRPFGVVFVGDPSTDVFMRTYVDAAVIPESHDVSFTTIEPRPAGPSEDMRRIMHLMRLNNEKRDRQMHEERLQYVRQLEEMKASMNGSVAVPPVVPAAPDSVLE